MSQMQEKQNSGISGPVSVTQALPDASKVIAKAQSTINDQKVLVIHGANEGYFDLTGRDVGSVRKALREAFSIPGDAEARVDGKVVGDDHVLGSGQALEFSKTAGEKG